MASGGRLSLDQNAFGGSGGSALKGSAASYGVAGAAGYGASSLTASSTTAASFSGDSSAFGGDGGDSAAGAAGATGGAIVALTGGAQVDGYATAKGGSGGLGWAGAGGAGAAASATSTATSSATGRDAAKVRSYAAGGSGGGSFAGSGGGGGTATAAATASDANANVDGGSNYRTYAQASATGGGGGSGSGAGQSGGAGGAITVAGAVKASVMGFNAYARAYAKGGTGGEGYGGATSGAGGEVSLTNAASGQANHYLRLRQDARGGYGGQVKSGAGAGGAVGAASSALTFDDTTNSVHPTEFTGLSEASGGNGGGGVGAAGGAGGDGGAAAASIALTGIHTVVADAFAGGGNAGPAHGTGKTGGIGGAGTANASASGYNVNVRADARGGQGGRGYGGANAGAGGASRDINAVYGASAGGYLKLYQSATGGSGGSAFKDGAASYGAAGSGGGANSTFTFDETLNPVQSPTFTGTSAATGGAGGANAGGSGGAGGYGNAVIDLIALADVAATASATGGAGGAGMSAAAMGGTATAIATAAATGSGTIAENATATATGGGSGAQLGAANATALGVTPHGQSAQASANATGSSGAATSIAQTNETGPVVSINSQAQSPATSLGENAYSQADAASPYAYDSGAHDAWAYGTANPNATYVSGILAANSNIAWASAPGAITGLGASFSAVWGSAFQGMLNPANAAGSHEYKETQTFTLDGTQVSGHLIVGLAGTQVTGSTGDTTDFTSLQLTVSIDGVQAAASPIFTSLSAAQAWLSNNAVDAGTFGYGAVQAAVTLDVVTGTAGFGIGQQLVVGTTDAYAPPVVSGAANLVVQQGQQTAIAGVQITEATPLTTDAVSVELKDTTALLSVTTTQGTVGGSGSTDLTISGTLSEVNADLATLGISDSTLPGDAITITSTDSRTGDFTRTVNVSVNAPPALAVGGAQVLSQNVAAAIGGVSLSDPDSGLVTEAYTVTVADGVGLLSATGAGIYGNDTTGLTITGSLAQVNADLATLTDTVGTPGSDTITFNANDGRGGTAPQQTIALTISGAPTLSGVPAALTVGQGQTASLAGISYSEADTTGGETFSLTVSDTSGVLTDTGAGVSGSGTNSLTFTGSLSQINTSLAGLQVNEASSGTDTITVTALDSNGGSTPVVIAVTANGLPAIAAPATGTASVGAATGIAGVSVSESGNTARETFSVTITDGSGDLTANGFTGDGTTSISISGVKLSNLNADLATLSDTDPTPGADTIHLTASDSLGNAAAAASIAITCSESISLTTGVDHLAGDGDDIILAPSGATLSKGDVIDGGGGTTVLEMQGGGTFKLSLPTTLTGIATVTATEGVGTAKPTIDLRNGLNVTVKLTSGGTGAGATVNGANDASVIDLGNGKDSVTVGSASETVNGGGGADTITVKPTTIGATIDGGSGKSVLDFTGGTGTMGANITNIHTVVLKAASVFTANALSGLTITGSKFADTITAGGAGQTLTGGGGADTLIGVTGGGDTFSDKTLNLNGATIENFAAAGDKLDITDMKFAGASLSWTQNSGSGVLTVTNSVSHQSAATTLTGTFAQTDFTLGQDSHKDVLITQSGGSLTSVQRLAFVHAMGGLAGAGIGVSTMTAVSSPEPWRTVLASGGGRAVMA